jgi:hypothetical protein
VKLGNRRVESELGEEQEAYSQAYIQLSLEQVYPNRYKGSGYEAAKTPDGARTLRAAEASKTRG